MRLAKNLMFYWLVYCLITIATQHIFDFNKLIYDSLVVKMTVRQVEEIFAFQKKWQWLNYVILPLLLLIKTTIITSILYIAIFFSKAEVTFKAIFNKVILAEFIFLLVPIFKLFWFCFFQTKYKLEDIQNFFPLSAINITGYEGLEPWYIYPLQTLNLFEVAYVFFLGYQIAKLTKSTPDEGLRMVVTSYVPALLLWVCYIMFLTLNYS